MAKKKSNTLLIVGAIAVGGYLLWKHSQTAIQSNVIAPVPTGTTATTVLNTVPVVTSVTDDPRVIEIQKWIATIPAPQLTAWTNALSVMTSAEKDGLYDIVLNDFYGNGITTDAQRIVWNTLRNKYNIP